MSKEKFEIIFNEFDKIESILSDLDDEFSGDILNQIYDLHDEMNNVYIQLYENDGNDDDDN